MANKNKKKKKVEPVTKKTGKKTPAKASPTPPNGMDIAMQAAANAGLPVRPLPKSGVSTPPTITTATTITPDAQVLMNQGLPATPGSLGLPIETKDLRQKDSNVSADTQDAFAMVKDLFTQYNLEELIPAINELMISGVGPAAATLALKTDPKYNKDAAGNPIGYARRFAGNEMRRKQGLNVLSEAEYLALENSYSETLTAYGLNDYFGPKGKERTQKMADVIGANISAVEFNDRIKTASDRVMNTDKTTRDTFKLLYGITDSDLTRYFLDPKNNVNVLKEKVATAEIYGSAVAQGLAGSVEVSTELAKMGVDKELARQGYAVIAEVLPEATKLSQIYDEMPAYTQQTAEAEVFQGLASAQRTRQRLVQRELAAFSGESGLSKGSLDREVGGRI